MAKEKVRGGKTKSLQENLPKDSECLVSFSFRGRMYEGVADVLELPDLTPDSVRGALNRVPAKFAYWSNIFVDISDVLDKEVEDFDLWKAAKYSEVDDSFPRKTETYKKNTAILDNLKEYKKRKEVVSTLQLAKDRCSILVKAFDMQSRTLQSIGSLFKKEMDQLT